MAEEQNGAAEPKEQQQAQPRLNVISQYIRDMSFENVAFQKNVDMAGKKPEVQVQVALDASKKGDDVYEVVNKIKVESKVDDAPIFIMELDFAGLFRVENVSEQQLHPFLMIECPRMIFPYIRRIVGDVTRDGGFPPLNLENIDYMNIYRQNLAQRVAEQKAAEKPAS